MNVKSLLCGAAMLSLCSMAYAVNYTVQPQDGKAFTDRQSLQSFNVTVDGDYKIAVKPDAKATLMNEATGGDDVYSTSFVFNEGFGMLLIKFNAEDISANGTWTFTIPKGQFTVDGQDNEPISTTYTLDDPAIGAGTTTYEPITLVSVTPADGTEMAYFGGEELPKITFKTSNDASVNFIDWFLYDVTNNTKEYIRQGESNRIDPNRYHNTDDHWTEGLFVEVGGVADKLIKGHTYNLEVRFCGIGYDLASGQYPTPDQKEMSTLLETTIIYKGKVDPPTYSPSEYVSVSPDPLKYEITNPDLAEFTITYSGPAKPTKFEYSLGSGAGSASAGTFAVAEGQQADANGCATAWTFKFDKSVVEQATGTIITSVVSQDKDGLYVKGNGNMVFDDNEYTMSWLCNCGATALTAVTPTADAEVATLSTITISNAESLPMGFSYNTTEKPEIRTMTGDLVRTLGEPTFSTDTKQASWTFDPITESGTYVFIVPAKYFIVGEDMITTSNNLTEFTYYVLGEDAGAVKYILMPKTITPTNNSNVEELATVTLEFADVTTYRMDGSSPKAKLYKVTDKEEMLIEEKAAEDNPDSDFNNPTIFDFKFTKQTEDGTYKVVIEKGTFGSFAWDEANGESGVANPQIVLNYTIGAVPAQEIALVSVTPADNAEVEELSSVSISNEKTAAMALNTASTAKAEIRTMTGGVVCELEAPTFNADKTQATWNFTAITEDGNYLLHVPAQYFLIGDGQDTNADSFFTYYVVSAEPGNVSYTVMPKSVTPADGSTVAEIATITLEFAEVTFSSYDAPKAKLYKVDGATETLIEEKEVIDNPDSDFLNPTIYDYNFAKVTDAGKYKVVIAQGTFGTGDWADTMGETGKANPEIVLNYTIGTVSVDAIIAAGEPINVYNAQGIQLLRNAEPAALRELPAGFYIVNGNKIMLRK